MYPPYWYQPIQRVRPRRIALDEPPLEDPTLAGDTEVLPDPAPFDDNILDVDGDGGRRPPLCSDGDDNE